MFFSYYLLLFKIIEVFYILAVSILPITKELFSFLSKGNYLQPQSPKDILLYNCFILQYFKQSFSL